MKILIQKLKNMFYIWNQLKKNNLLLLSQILLKLVGENYMILQIFQMQQAVAKKNNADCLVWIGYNNIKNHFEELIKEKNINNYDLSLEQLFPIDDCMGLSNITISFILLFYAPKIDHLGIHCAARFLTRNTFRYKKTLTKILEIEKVLTAFDLMCKAAQNDEVLLATKYFQLEIVPEINDQSQTIIGSINSFLNSEKSRINDAIIKRRKEFESFNKVKKNT